MEKVLEVKDLLVQFRHEYGVIEAVRGVSFSIAPGETLAVVGESGCGKSVMCKSLVGILPHSGHIAGGEVVLNGIPVQDLEERALCALRGTQAAMIFQDPMTSLNPTIPIGKQIMEPILLHEKVTKAEAKRRALELMELVGIDDAEKRFKQYPHHFSGGMRQRVVIAIALALRPKLLIADEPTTALDVTIQAQIIDLLKDLQKKTGVAILFITHDLGVVAKVADRVAVMYAGKIVEIGTADEVFHDPRHPYTWALMGAMPSTESQSEYLKCIGGMPPFLLHPPKGDAFAERNPYALAIDYEAEPPLFPVSETHFAATWLLHPDAPKIAPPVRVVDGRILTVEDGK